MAQKTNQSAWLKDHPLIYFCTAVGAVTAFIILVFKEVVLPAMTSSLQGEIAFLKRQLNNEGGDMGTLRKRIQELESELTVTKENLTEALKYEVFYPHTPYPLGLANVRLGDPIDKASKVFPEGSTQRERYAWRVLDRHPLFPHVAYHFESNKRISLIIMLYNVRLPSSVIQEKLSEAMGSQALIDSKADCSIWKYERNGSVKFEKATIAIHSLLRMTCP